jgi:hypothetical protein
VRASISWTGEPHDLARFRSAAPSAVYGSRVAFSRHGTTTDDDDDEDDDNEEVESTRVRWLCVTLMRDHVRHIRSGERSGRVVDPDPRRLNDLTVPRRAVPYREPARTAPADGHCPTAR